MKKISLLFLFLFVICFITVSQTKKVAVVTFYVDKNIDMSAIPGAIGAAAQIASLAGDTAFNLTPVLNNFHDVFFNEYAQQFPFELIPEATVLGNADYQNFESKLGESDDEDQNKFFQQFITYEGYKPLYFATITKKENRNHLRMLEMFPEADGVMFVALSYAFVQKMAIGGIGSATIQGFVQMKLWNKEGERVFNIYEWGQASKSVPMIAGIPVMEPKKLIPLCEDSTQKVVADLKKKLNKITRKATKNL